MARPTKKGLDYFPLDVDFLSDLKVRRIIKACGKEAVHILVALLANIYRDEGYYVLWDDDLAFLVADEVGTKEGTVEELVKKAVQVRFFDKDIFDKYSVLTSKGIQSRYILATKERKKVELENKYLLTNEVNRSNISINGRNNSVNQGNNQQSKEKESKEKESKEQPTDEEEYLIKIYSYLESNGFGSPYGNTMGDNIKFWFQDLEEVGLSTQEADEWLILGADTAISNNSRNWRYLDGILRNRFNKRLFTKEAIEGADVTRQTGTSKSCYYSKKPIRTEPIPEWLNDPEEYNAQKEAEIMERLRKEAGDDPFGN
ncbi:Lin1244/Lin1753 domain-containing protein [Enterococcus gallinarum]|uniref:Lin1244/Lin1753 domain-containing protein n=1 Tax=Enterococcus gallinarum TaxID=1353 RepID=UPI0035D54881